MEALADSGVRKDDVVGTAAVSSRVAMRRADAEEDEEGMMAEGENAEVPAARRTHETAVVAMESFIPFYVLFYGFVRKMCF